MIHVINANNRHLYATQIAEMHQLRRVHFVEENGWNDLTVLDGGEVDDFDDDRTVYLLGLDEDDRIEVGLRVRPTDDICILADKFPSLVAADHAPVKGANAWEMSRIFTSYEYRKNRLRGRRVSEAFLAAMEVANARGATRLVGMIDIKLYPLATAMAWDLRMTGLPGAYAFGTMTGVQVTIDDTAIFRMRESLASMGFASYEIEQEDLDLCGDFQGVERVFACARRQTRLDIADVDEAPQAIARAAALYALMDAASPPAGRSR